MATVAEKKRRVKLRALQRAVTKAQVLAAELGASDVIVRLAPVAESVRDTISGRLECVK